MIQLTARGEGGRCYGHKGIKRQDRIRTNDRNSALFEKYNVRRIEDKCVGSDHVTSTAFSRCFPDRRTSKQYHS
jgi:hypothetical protein